MARQGGWIGVAAVCLALSGCGTFILEPLTRVNWGLHGGGKKKPPKIFGGLRAWARFIDDPLMFGLFILDFPLSLTADIVILPYTIAMNAGSDPKPPPSKAPIRSLGSRTFNPRGLPAARVYVELYQGRDPQGHWLRARVRNIGKVEARVEISSKDGRRMFRSRVLQPSTKAELTFRLNQQAPFERWRDLRVQIVSGGKTYDLPPPR